MRFFIDQQLPSALAEWLRGEGLDAVHLRELGLGDHPDHGIWLTAVREGGVVVYRDSDFINFARQDQRGRLVWVRIGNCTNPVLITRFEAAWPEAMARLQAGERVVEVRP